MKKKSIKKAILMLFVIIMLAVQISVCVSALNATPSEYEISDDHSSMAMATPPPKPPHEHTDECYTTCSANPMPGGWCSDDSHRLDCPGGLKTLKCTKK